jgi:RecB family exonuclease
MEPMLPTATTVSYGPAPNKPFAWSWSKIKNYETCPRRHYNVDVLKKYKDESPALTHGNNIHKYLAARLEGAALPPEHMSDLEPWAKWALEGPGTIHVENELAITKDFLPCEWFDSNNRDGKKVWFRAKVDAIKVHGPGGVVIDWKTGKAPRDDDDVDNAQLLLNAATAFIHYPGLRKIRSCFVWLQDNKVSPLDLHKEQTPEVWAELFPRVEALREAYEASKFPPTPSYLCARYCPVKTCEHWGKEFLQKRN